MLDGCGEYKTLAVSWERRDELSAFQMTTIRRFRAQDLFRFNSVNLDPLTETYSLSFYLQYLSQWPDYFSAAQHPSGQIMGFCILRFHLTLQGTAWARPRGGASFGTGTLPP